jgi:hypothetical protein
MQMQLEAMCQPLMTFWPSPSLSPIPLSSPFHLPTHPAFFKFFGIFTGSVLVGLLVGGGAAWAFKGGFFYAEPLPADVAEKLLYARKAALVGEQELLGHGSEERHA